MSQNRRTARRNFRSTLRSQQRVERHLDLLKRGWCPGCRAHPDSGYLWKVDSEVGATMAYMCSRCGGRWTPEGKVYRG